MKQLIQKTLEAAVKRAGYDLPANFSLEAPAKPEFGDFATNVALLLASEKKEKTKASNPREIAEKIASFLTTGGGDIKKAEVAGPGFVNIFIKEKKYLDELEEIVQSKENYGRGKKSNKKIQIEYISANPTGPLHVGNARGGPIGEALANLYDFLGFKVEREFYVNDMGLQIERFGRSLYFWYAKKTDSHIEFPADGYPAPYVKEISEKIQEEKKKELSKLKDEPELIEFFVKEGLYYTVKSIREDCELLNIKFDTWFYESDLQHSGKTEQIIEKLKKDGYTVSKEGALWFKNPEDPELQDKESVLVKSDGKSLTYFADDIAYHVDKFERGFDKVINIWGANHHGHLPRFNAAMKVMGFPEEKIKVLFYQYIRLKKNGKVVSMGKRLGNFVTLRQVLESGVEADAFKYFILSQNPNTPFDFDLALAADTSEKNPVFYIKYAHARICSILKKAGLASDELAVGEGGAGKIEKTDYTILKDPAELALVKELVKFREIIYDVSHDFQIQSIPHYSYKIATLFHNFYAHCQVISEDEKLTQARLALVLATKYVLSNTLAICGIEAPDEM